jgi:hypothetical protein
MEHSMQRLLAIDCDPRELCLVLGTAVGERITLEATETISFVRGADDPLLTAEELGKRLQTVLAKHKRTGARILMGVDRNAIELFDFPVPPATDAELPELVLNQVTTASPNLAEESVIDFVANGGVATESRRITAAALSRTEFDRVTGVCNAAGMTPDRMLMRSYATAALFLQGRNLLGQNLRAGNSLLVNVIDDEVDLIVIDQVQALFFRTVRLPGVLGNEFAETRLLDEVRRTLLVAPQSAAVSQAIETVYVVGTAQDHQRLAEQIARENGIHAEQRDPYAGFLLAAKWEQPSSGRLIPLLGMLTAEVHGGKHSLDFQHPKRPPKPPNRTRQLVMSLSAVALLGGAGAYYLWDIFSTADAEIKRLASELSDLEGLVKKTTEKKKVADALEDWNANSVVWLDELRDFSAKLPTGQDLVLQRLTMSPARGGRASLAFQGLAREPNVVTRMEATLRDTRHEVQTPRVDERIQDKSYPWNFETSVSLTPARIETKSKVPANSGKDSLNGTKKKTGVKAAGTEKKTSKQGTEVKEASPEQASDQKDADQQDLKPSGESRGEQNPPRKKQPPAASSEESKT